MRIRILALAVSLLLLCAVALLGCGGNKNPSSSDSSDVSQPLASSDDTNISSDTTVTDNTTTDESKPVKTTTMHYPNTTASHSGPKVSVAVQKNLTPLTSEGDMLLLNNPDRGFRTEYVCNVKDAVDSGNPTSYFYGRLDSYLNTLGEPCKLMLAYVYLTEYRNTEISDVGMEAIQAFFDLCRSKGVKLMLRFSYCDSWQNLSTGADQTTIIRHIKQLASIVKNNADVIHTLSCGFVGAYGEWAKVYQVPPVDYATVINNIVKYLCEPNQLFFSIRLPQYKNLINKSSPYYNMIAHNNDAMFGAQTKKGWDSEGYQLGTDEWNQVIKEGYLTPQDGEMFVNVNMVETNRKPSGMEIILETTQHRHVSMSFWHGYHEVGAKNPEAVMNAWKTEYVTESLLKNNNVVYCPSWFKNEKGKTVQRNAFEFIRDHLGYKIEAQNIKVTGNGKAGSTASVTMTLKNYGMAAAFYLESGFAILDEDYELVSSIKAGKPSSWHSHSTTNYKDTKVPTHTIKSNVKLPSKSGRYYLAFYLKNTMDDFARLSNKIDVADGYNLIHAFDI